MEEKKSSKALVIILVVIIVGLVSFICYDKFFSKKENNNVKEPEEIVEKKGTAISIDSAIVKTAMESFKKIRISDDDLYKNGGYNISSISKLYLLLTATDNLDDEYIDPCNGSYKAKTASVDVLNSVIAKYIYDKKITLDDIKSVIKNAQELSFIVLKGNGVIVEGACDGIFEHEDYTENKLLNAETDGDYLYVYEKIAFARFNEFDDESFDDIPKVNYYKDYSKTNVVEKNKHTSLIIKNDQVSPDSIPNWDLYNTYKYTFKKINGTYYFQSFELS